MRGMEALSLIYAASALAGLGIIVFEIASPQGEGHSEGGDHSAIDSGSDSGSEGEDSGDASVHAENADANDSSSDGRAFTATLRNETGSAEGQKGLSIALKGLRAIRSLVYLSLGFGATGLFAVHALGQGLESRASASAGALVAMGSAFAVRKLLRKELDSSLSHSDFLFEECIVDVAIEPGRLGMVRVRKYGIEARLYARFADPEARAAKGDRLRIVESGVDGCVVEHIEA